MSRVVIDPALRGRATPALLDRLARAGWRVVRIGRAAYLSSPGSRGARWLVVVGDAPSLEARIDGHHAYLIGRGPAPALEVRREAAWLRQRHELRLRAPDGRFAGRLPWWATVDAVGRLLTPRELQPWRVG
jgi:hypothetical protein